jgi:hypothetical protein
MNLAASDARGRNEPAAEMEPERRRLHGMPRGFDREGRETCSGEGGNTTAEEPQSAQLTSTNTRLA